MALNKNALKSEIEDLLSDMTERNENSYAEFADRLSTAIDTYVKGAVIVYQNGLLAPNGAVTGVFNGELQ